jgi:hypothetical protein
MLSTVPVFRCCACRAAITGNLTLLHGPLVRPPSTGRRGERSSTIPTGWFGIDPEPFGAPLVPAADQETYGTVVPGLSMNVDGVEMTSAGPRDTIVIHPSDAPSLLRHPDPDRHEGGCCGRPGTRGNNLICPCGQEVATLMDDCGLPYELHLDPTFVRNLDA